MTTGAEIHLVGSLAAKRRVGKTIVVLPNVEGYEAVDGFSRVERVQVEPLMLERVPMIG